MSEGMKVDIDRIMAAIDKIGYATWFADEVMGVDSTDTHLWLDDGDAIIRCYSNIGHMPNAIEKEDLADYLYLVQPNNMLSMLLHYKYLVNKSADEDGK